LPARADNFVAVDRQKCWSIPVSAAATVLDCQHSKALEFASGTFRRFGAFKTEELCKPWGASPTI
jgi:hypothetical protein